MLAAREIVAADVVVWLGTGKDGLFPADAYQCLMSIANREAQAMTMTFPEVAADVANKRVRDGQVVSFDGVMQRTRGNAARNYYRLGLEVKFAVGFGFDPVAFIRSLAKQDGVNLEAEVSREKPDGSGYDWLLFAGQSQVLNEQSYAWKMMFSRSAHDTWVKERDRRGVRFLDGRHVAFTGTIGKWSANELVRHVQLMHGVYQEHINDDTGILFVGRDPDKDVVDQALQEGVATMSEINFNLLADSATGRRWEVEKPKKVLKPVRDEIFAIFEEHGLHYHKENLPDDEDITNLDAALVALDERHVVCAYHADGSGVWTLRECGHIVDGVERVNDGRVKIENFVVQTIGSDVVEHGECTDAVNVSFSHNGTDYAWSFRLTYDDRLFDYLDEVGQWAEKVLGRGCYVDSSEGLTIWWIDPMALKALRKCVAGRE